MGVQAGGLANMFLAAQGASAVAGAANSFVQARAMRQQGAYENQVALDNAAMLELQARDAEKAGERAAALRGLETRSLIERQRLAASGQGIDPDSGSVAALTGDTAAFGAMDAEMEANNAWRQAFGIRAEATGMRRAGRNARDASRFNARMTLASGGLQFGRDAIGAGYGYTQFRKKETS